MAVDLNILADELPSLRRSLDGTLPSERRAPPPTPPDGPRRFRCLRCRYEWSPRRKRDRRDDAYTPRACPRCYSTGWHSERAKRMGRSRKPKAAPKHPAPLADARPVVETLAPPPASAKRPLPTEPREEFTSGATSVLCSLGLLRRGTPAPRRR